MRTKLGVLFSLVLLLGLALQACTVGRGRGGGDDDDDDDSAADDDDSAVAGDDDDGTPGDDDDAAGPLEGDWEGTGSGLIEFGAVQYTCSGPAEATVDQFGLATGTLACEVNEVAATCGVAFASAPVDGSQTQQVLDCTSLLFPMTLTENTENHIVGSITGTTFDEVNGIDVTVSINFDLLR